MKVGSGSAIDVSLDREGSGQAKGHEEVDQSGGELHGRFR